jgi:cellulose synthase (UDP-forming)
VALVTGQSFVNVTYPQFLLHFAPLSIVLQFLAFRWRATGTYRPSNAPVLSWECIFFQFARWPWALAGTIAALRDWMTGSVVEFRITPKGGSEVNPLPVRVMAPYAFLSFASVLPVVLIDNSNEAGGFYVFALINAVLYAVLLSIIVVQHARENVVKVTNRTYRAGLAMAFAAILTLTGLGTARNGMDGLYSLAWGAGRVSLFRETFAIAGAGLGEAGIRRIRFEPQWLPETPAQTGANQKDGRTEPAQQ